MKKTIITSAVVLFSVIAAWGGSPKRGVSENAFSMAGQLACIQDDVCWYYNWGNVPGKGYENGVIDADIEFVPMCWNTNYSADAIREYCKSHPKTKYLLGFNEPNFVKQANLTPQQAAEAWPAVKALADELGLKLVAPALNYSPDAPYHQPTAWMDEFVALVGLDAFDYTAVHNYGGFEVLKRIAGDFHDKYGKDVWVTEFCLWPNEGDANSTVLPEAQMASMAESLEWLETTPWIYRYAWFKALGASAATKGPNYGLIEKTPGGGAQDWRLTPQGYLYTQLGQFGDDCILPTDATHSAIRYTHGEKLRFGAVAQSEYPVSITEFNGGALADWCFDVPEEGVYQFSIMVGGDGEPTRYDPTLTLSLVGADGGLTTLAAKQKYQLPGAGKPLAPLAWNITLPAGTQRIRLAESAQYNPSGMIISSVALRTGANALPQLAADTADTPCDIYTLQGTCLGRGIPADALSDHLTGSTQPLILVTPTGAKKIMN